MKAAPLSTRPGFTLQKQTDIQSFYHFQMPRWLFSDNRYRSLTSDAKIVYTLLLNRFQLSRLNGWINGEGEVFIIYTRESLADETQISYRKAIAAMRELSAAGLIWERRCGRGDANQIYLAKVETREDVPAHASAPFAAADTEESRTAKNAGLDEPENTSATVVSNECADARHAETALLERQKAQVKTCENSTSRPVGFAVQDLQNSYSSDNNKNNIDLIYTDRQSVCLSRASPRPRGDADRPTDNSEELEEILESCELWTFAPETGKVFESAIERLFYSESFKIGNAVLPQARVRSHLHRLDMARLQDAERKIAANTGRPIRNTTAYAMAVIFNSIWESESDLMCDPYLNSLRAPPGSERSRVRCS